MDGYASGLLVMQVNPKPKHLPKVHVWGGISKHGATAIVIFTGTLMTTRYCDILQDTLLPFVRKVFPDSHIVFNKIMTPSI